MAEKKVKSNDTDSFEQKLWKTADKLRKNIDAAEYKHTVLGLIFLKYISDAFNELHQKLVNGEGDYQGADPEDRDEYTAENVFFVPIEARWSTLQAQAKQPDIGKTVDLAMEAIERENAKRLKGILPKVYGQQKLDSKSLGGLIDLIGSITLGDAEAQAQDVLGRVYEYFLGQFALAEGKKGGQFYTPESIVRLLVQILEPYHGRVFDPCCGSGGMFVQSEKFVKAHQGRLDDISIYGQESNETTYKLCRMNLAIRGIDGTNIKWNPEGSLLNDAHKDLKADFVIANPPFNDSDWSGDLLRNDGRWQFGTPPDGNANFAWVQHFIYHLSPIGSAGFVLSNGSLSSNTSGEGDIRKKLVTEDLVDCIVMLPTQLFYNTGIPACLWFLSRYKNGNKNRDRKGEVLFIAVFSRMRGNRILERLTVQDCNTPHSCDYRYIDASELGYMVNRSSRAFSEEEISKIADTYHEWKKAGGSYQDVKGFCKSASLADIEKHNFVLTPGRYVGIPDEVEDGILFEDKMRALTSDLAAQLREAEVLDLEIKTQLAKVGFSLEEVL